MSNFSYKGWYAGCINNNYVYAIPQFDAAKEILKAFKEDFPNAVGFGFEFPISMKEFLSDHSFRPTIKNVLKRELKNNPELYNKRLPLYLGRFDRLND